jgi:hypothetical protein
LLDHALVVIDGQGNLELPFVVLVLNGFTAIAGEWEETGTPPLRNL